MMKFVVTCLILVSTINMFSQEGVDEGAAYVKEFKDRLPKDFFETEEGGSVAIDSISRLASHKNAKIRSFAQYKILEIGVRNKSLNVKIKSVNALLKFSFEPDVAIRRNNSNVYQSFPKEAYTDEFVEDLKSVLHNDSFVNRGHILLVGYLGLEEEKAYLENHFVVSRGRFNSDFSLGDINRFDFAARMALARMGDNEHARYVVERIMQDSERDLLNKRMTYLSYIKHPEAIEIMIDFLFSDQFSMDVIGRSWKHPIFVMKYLQETIIDFPSAVPTMLNGYSEAEITAARNWMSEHRDNYKINYNVW